MRVTFTGEPGEPASPEETHRRLDKAFVEAFDHFDGHLGAIVCHALVHAAKGARSQQRCNTKAATPRQQSIPHSLRVVCSAPAYRSILHARRTHRYVTSNLRQNNRAWRGAPFTRYDAWLVDTLPSPLQCTSRVSDSLALSCTMRLFSPSTVH